MDKLYKDMFDFVLPFYNEEHRVFHNEEHLKYGINLFNFLERQNEIIPETLVAAWLFHDVIYDLSSTTNEEDSADFFEKANKEQNFGFNRDEVLKIKKIILSTKTHESEDPITQILLDIDMMSLSFEWEEFLIYRNKVKDEYSAIYTDEEIKNGTISFIEKTLLNKENIIKTEIFKERFNHIAISNLERYLSILKA